MTIINPTPITALPTIPDSSIDQPTFDAQWQAFNIAMATPFRTQTNAAAAASYENALDAAGSATAAATSASTATTQAGNATTQVGLAATQATNAAASAVSAVNAPGTSGTSTTSLTIGSGTQTFTAQSAKAWVVGQPVSIARTSAPGTTCMYGTITAYNSGTGSMSVLVGIGFIGSGTFTDWTIGLSGTGLPLKTVGGQSLLGVGNVATDTFSIGDVVTSTQVPTAGTWLALGSGVYLQSSYAALYAKIGLIADTPNNAGVWTNRTATSSDAWSAVTFGNGVFVAVAGGPSMVAATSPDGITWTARTLPSSQNWNAVAFGGGLFVAICSDTGTVAASSPDGITWTARTLATSASYTAITWGNGLFVAVSTTSAASSSANGTTWTARTLSVSQVYLSIAYGAGVFVALSNTTSASSSPDGITWTNRTVPSLSNYRGVAYGSGYFLAVTNGGGTARSTDGVTWVTSGTTIAAQSVAFGGGVFVATPQTGTAASYSKDAGATWTAGSALPSSTTWRTAFGGDKFVAVGLSVATWSSSSSLFSFSVATQFVLPAPVATPFNTYQYIKGL